MKKIFLLILLSGCLAFTFCGGKEMNDPADGSNNGPSYRNEFDDPKKLEVEADSTKTD